MLLCRTWSIRERISYFPSAVYQSPFFPVTQTLPSGTQFYFDFESLSRASVTVSGTGHRQVSLQHNGFRRSLADLVTWATGQHGRPLVPDTTRETWHTSRPLVFPPFSRHCPLRTKLSRSQNQRSIFFFFFFFLVTTVYFLKRININFTSD